MITIGFVGMTHLGLNSAAAAADRGFRVVAFDTKSDLIAELASKLLPVSEPGLDEAVARNEELITFTSDRKVLSRCNVIYIAPDVPTNEQGQSDLSHLTLLVDLCRSCVSSDATLVILSQVPPGFTRQVNFPKCRLYYQVETLVFGEAFFRARNPERFIVGCAEPERPLADDYRAFLEGFECQVLTMTYESAELCKISINMFLVAQVSCANQIAEMCEKMGGNYREIIPALRLDRRIGRYSYIACGLGISGGNLERDLTTFREMGYKYGVNTDLVETWLLNSGNRKDWPLRVLHRILHRLPQSPRIAVLGIAYKENTKSIKNSPSVRLLESLLNFDVRCYDPIASLPVGMEAQQCATIDGALKDADIVVLMTAWPEFSEIKVDSFRRAMRGRIIIDPLGTLITRQNELGDFEYFTLGAKES